MHRRIVFVVGVLMGLLLGVASAPAQKLPTEDEAKAAYRRVMAEVSPATLQAHLTALTAQPSRIAGSEGEAEAMAYAKSVFARLGLQNIRSEEFIVTVPDPDARGTLTLGDRRVTLYPMWPNLVRTSSCAVNGKIVYGRRGRLEDLRGKDVRGSIVVLEFDSGALWRNAAKLGAAAIVFVETDQIIRPEAELKFSAVPIDVPRFFLRLQDAGPVLTAAMAGAPAKLVCRQNWVRRPSANLIAELPGTDPAARNERVELFAYADATSVVPGLAPGAESASGLATLLTLAEIKTRKPGRRPMRFVVSGAHGLALRGAREYIEQRIVTREAPAILTLTLDLASGSRTIGSYAKGWFLDNRDEPLDPVRQMSRTFRSNADRLAAVLGLPQARLALVDAVNQSDSRTWRNNIPGKFALDSEPMVNAGINALTFVTVEDSRPAVDTPADTLDNVNVANLVRQAQTVAVMLWHVLGDTSNRNETSNFRVPLEPRAPERMSLVGGFATLRGMVSIYDPQKSFVPDTPVKDSLAVLLGRQKTMMGVRGDMVQYTEGDRAQYRFLGIAPTSSYWWWQQQNTRIAAFRVNPSTGEIDHAPSAGIYGNTNYPTDFNLKIADRDSPIVVFPCRSVAVYDMVDPQDLRALGSLRVLDATTDAEPTDYGLFSPGQDQRLNPEIEDVQIVFLPLSVEGMKGRTPMRFKLLAGAGVGDNRLILTNSTVGDEAGKGYFAPGGPVDAGRASVAVGGVFQTPALQTATDILNINETRLERFRRYRIISPAIEDVQKQATEVLEQAKVAESRFDWPELDRQARAAWGFALRTHPVIMKTANDVVNGVVFYLFLLIPFSYFAERLVFANRLLTKQLAATVGIFLGSFLLLRLIHPAFEIVTNPTMIFIAFVMGALSIIVIAFILGKFESSMRVVKQLQSGVKELDIRRSSVALAAFSLGVGNMRRRKARTVLTTLTLVVMTFIVLSFTSIVSELQLNEFPSDTEATYSGMLIRNPGMDPLQLATYRQIASEFSGRADVVRRPYYYGADYGDTGILSLQRADRLAEVRSMVGFDPDETKVTGPDRAITAGRWFRPGETDVIILPAPLADQLKVEPAEVGRAKVTYAGREYTVVGVIDPAIMRSLIDLDGDGILPPDFSLSTRQQQETGAQNQAFRTFVRLDPASCFYVPAETALALGADLRTIAVRFSKATETRKAIDALMPRLRLNLYASVPSPDGTKLEVKQFSVFQASKGTGLALVVVQLLIAAIFVLNTMVASVYERTREIGIFSSIGLAPNHIAMLFFAESLVYGVFGAVIGYYAAQGTAKVIVATGAFPGLILNFSSTSAVLSAVLVMAVVLLSTIYPARKAAQIAAPAMNEEAFDTGPEGDEWRLPLPFSISQSEALPMIQFLGDWFKAYEEYTIGDFVSSGTEFFSSGEGAYGVRTLMWLAPYDLGVSQTLSLEISPSHLEGIAKLDLLMVRQGGDPENWAVVNRRFLDALRRQFLTFRALDATQRETFEEKGRETFSLGTPEPVA